MKTQLASAVVALAMSLACDPAKATMVYGYANIGGGTPSSIVEAADGSFNHSVSGMITDLAYNPATGDFHVATDEEEHVVKADGTITQGFFAGPLNAIAASPSTVVYGYAYIGGGTPASIVEAADGSFNHSVSGTITDLAYNPATGDFHVATDEEEHVVKADGTITQGFFVGPLNTIAVGTSVPEPCTAFLLALSAGALFSQRSRRIAATAHA